MSEVKIVSGAKRDHLKTLLTFLTVSLGILVGVIILFSHDNPSITGYSVFSNLYGSASPFVIVFLLMMIIAMYVRLHRE